MANQLVLFQIASVSALIGMTLGWRGVMTRYSGFYDLPTAWSNVFWGILLGGLYASQIHNNIILPNLEFEATQDTVVNPINLILYCLIMSIIVHFLLRRNRVRSGSSQTTSGWALGLAIGGMFAMVVIFAILQWYDFSPILLVSILMICLLAPRCEAIITSYQGHLMLMGKKWGAILRATMWRCGYVIMFAYVLSAPIGWIFILPVMLIADRASETWIWESIPKEGKKQLRKKIMQIQTDSTPLDDPKDPDSCTVFQLFKLIASEDESKTLRARYQNGGMGYGDAKIALFELLLTHFRKERNAFNYYIQNPEEVKIALVKGANKARAVAQEVLLRVRSKIGY